MKDDLPQSLDAALSASPAAALCVAFSGGPDSTALLHALAQLPQARARGLRALHVDHGLHPDSTGWTRHCASFCATLGIALATLRVTVEDSLGEGIEAAARRARYAAFREHLREGEWLATGHHRDDQVETVLLKLLRGAGPQGLGGMRVLRPLARGMLWRPLLETPRETLRNYLTGKGIDAIEDPANADPRFARNVLRDAILPQVTRHWPGAGAAILHSAQLARHAADYLADAARSAQAGLRDADGSLDAHGWLALHAALRPLVLDDWLRERSLPTPADAQRRELERQLATAATDAVPCVAWPGAEVRIWDGRLHAMPPLAPVPARWQAAWDGTTLALPVGCGTLALDTAKEPRFDPPLAVRFRRGGERIRPAGDVHTRELRDLFQQARVPPWWRERCPLVYADRELIAIADLWQSAQGAAIFAALEARLRWHRPSRTPLP